MPVKISVVFPVYNVQKYLRQSLDSLINQTFSDFEIICVNDGSTDSSLEILESYARLDSRIKIITQENRGLSGARNTGIKIATGEYILFVDSDDWLELDALEKLAVHVDKFKSDITMFKLKYFNEDTSKFSSGPFTTLEVIDSSLHNRNFNYLDVIDVLFKVSHTAANKLYKASFLEKFDVKFLDGYYYEDLEFFYRVFLKSQKASLLDEFIYFYRIRDNSITTKGDIKSFDIFKILEITKSHLMEADIYSLVKKDWLMFVIVNFKYVYLRLNMEYKNDFLESMKKYYGLFELGDVEDFKDWHYEDQSFYRSIPISRDHEIFDLNFEKFNYEFLANHYKNAYNQVKSENELLNQEKNSSKSIFKRIVKL